MLRRKAGIEFHDLTGVGPGWSAPPERLPSITAFGELSGGSDPIRPQKRAQFHDQHAERVRRLRAPVRSERIEQTNNHGALRENYDDWYHAIGDVARWLARGGILCAPSCSTSSEARRPRKEAGKPLYLVGLPPAATFLGFTCVAVVLPDRFGSPAAVPAWGVLSRRQPLRGRRPPRAGLIRRSFADWCRQTAHRLLLVAASVTCVSFFAATAAGATARFFVAGFSNAVSPTATNNLDRRCGIGLRSGVDGVSLVGVRPPSRPFRPRRPPCRRWLPPAWFARCHHLWPALASPPALAANDLTLATSTGASLSAAAGPGRRAEDEAPFVIPPETEQTAIGRLLEQVAGLKAVVVFAETRLRRLTTSLSTEAQMRSPSSPVGHQVDEGRRDDIDGLALRSSCFWLRLASLPRTLSRSRRWLPRLAPAVAHQIVVVNESVGLVISRSEQLCLTPTPMTFLAFSRSLETSGEKSESPEMITKVSTWALV